MRFFLPFLFLMPATMAVASADWNCRNKDMEISCDADKCIQSDGFTPMDIHIGEDGTMRVCAYTGCWEGAGAIYQSENFIVAAGHRLEFSTHPSGEMKADFLIAIDSGNGIAVVNGSGYAMPALCKKVEKD